MIAVSTRSNNEGTRRWTTSAELAAYRRWASKPLTESPLCSVVIPAYNETERIVPTIGAIATHMSAIQPRWELIVADDGSSDETVAMLEELQLPNLTVLTTATNGGKGSAVRRGVLAARAPVVLVADADQSTPIEQFGRLASRLADGADIVVGSRAAAGAAVENKSTLRHLLSKGLNTIVRRSLRIDLADTQCGFKLFKTSVAQDLFAQQHIPRFAFDLEVLFLAQRRGYRVEEMPVEWIDAPGSTVDPLSVSVEFLNAIAKIRWNAVKGRYRRFGGVQTNDHV